ncbi:hypothetical protein ACFLXJ_06310 [Chloroflexota bacterium]
MKVKTVAIIEIVLGVLVIAAFTCSSIYANIVLGALVLAFGIVLLVRPK